MGETSGTVVRRVYCVKGKHKHVSNTGMLTYFGKVDPNHYIVLKFWYEKMILHRWIDKRVCHLVVWVPWNVTWQCYIIMKCVVCRYAYKMCIVLIIILIMSKEDQTKSQNVFNDEILGRL